MSSTTRKQIEASIRDKSYAELSKIFEQTQSQLLTGRSQFYTFDKTMVEALKPEMARAKLRDLHVQLRGIYDEEQRVRVEREEEDELGEILEG